MPKGVKTCECGKQVGVRTKTCTCGYAFPAKTKEVKQEKIPGNKVKQTKHPLGLKFVPSPGLWVFHKEQGLPPIHAPCDLPSGPITNQEVYDYCAFNGLGDSIYEYIKPEKIADKKLQKLWKKAQDALGETWRYLINDNENGK